MSLSKPFTVAKVTDSILGSFSLIPPSETLNHLIRYLGTWSGSDKFFMVLQYTLQLLVPLLNLRARLQCRAGLRKLPTSDTAVGLSKFAKLISDSRTLWRIWGLLPIFQWLIALERKAPSTRSLLNIERLQGWSMLGYYPLEHLSYLTSREIIPSSFSLPFSRKSITLKPGALGMWSVRFWALYVVLQFAHLQEDRKLLMMRQRTLRKAKGAAPNELETQDLRKRWDSYWSELVLNSANLPLALHWSTEKGLIKNSVIVDGLCLLTAIGSFRTGWKATALPPSPPPKSVEEAPALPDEKEMPGMEPIPTAFEVSSED